MDYALVGYPLSADYKHRFESALGGVPEYLSLSELRRLPLPKLVWKLASLRADRMLLPLEDAGSRSLLPAMQSLAAISGARSIELFRHGDIQNALPIIDSLTNDMPQDPYFWELKAQALLENGRPAEGIPAIERARKLLPNNGLLQLLNAQILIATERLDLVDKAVTLLTLAKKTEGDTPDLFKQMAAAYAIKGDVPRAELATAEYAYAIGDKQMALEKAKRAQSAFKHGTKEWLRANDLVTFASRK